MGIIKNPMINKIKKNFFNREFLTFIIVGFINTFIGTILASIYSLLLQVNVAFVLGYLSSLVIAYVINSIFTFKEKLILSKGIKFAISYIPNFIIQNIIVLIFYNTLHFHKLIAFGIAAVIGIPVTFVILKLFVFKKKNKDKRIL